MRAPHPAAARRVKVVLCSLSALFLALFAFPANLESFLFGGAPDVPLASLFMTWLRSQLAPPGWILNTGNGISELGGELQPVVLLGEASLVLTLIIGYPLIAFVLFERIVPSGAEHRRRLVYTLTSFTSATFFAGVLFGIFFLAKVFLESLPPTFGTAVALDSGGFYLAGLGVVSILALVSTLPFLLLGFARSRSSPLSDYAPKVTGLGI